MKMACPRSTILLVLHSIVFLLSINTGVCVAQRQSESILVTNCSAQTTLPPGENVTIVSVPLNTTDTGNCTWLLPIPAADNPRVGTTMFMVKTGTDTDPLCKVGDLRVTDGTVMNGTIWSRSLCNAALNLPGFNTRPGFPALVSLFLLESVQRNDFLFAYNSYEWAGKECPEHFMRINVTGETQEIRVGYETYADFLPNGLSCYWQLASPDQGVVRIELQSSVVGSKCTESSQFLLIRDEIGSSNPASYDLCKYQPFSVHHTSLTGSVFLELHTAETGPQSPKFYISYDAVPVCGHSLPLQAPYDEEAVFKGASDLHDNATCSWNISTSITQSVIMLTRRDNKDFVPGCSAHDYLSLDGEKISLCDNSSLRAWSRAPSVVVTLHHQPTAFTRFFVVTYTRVRHFRGCQGRTEVVRAEKLNSPPYGISDGVYYNFLDSLSDIGSNCRWTFQGSSNASSEGLKLEVMVKIWEGFYTGRQDCSLWKNKFVARVPQKSVTSDTNTTDTVVLSPSCTRHRSDLRFVFLTDEDTLTLEYKVGGAIKDTTFSVYQRLTSSANVAAFSWTLAVCLTIALKLFQL